MLPDAITTLGIIDSSLMFCEGFYVIIPRLSRHFKPVFKASGYEDLLQQIAEGVELPSMLLIGVTNPIKKTIDIATMLNENHSEIILLSFSNDYPEGSKYQLIEAGFKGFMYKDDNNDIILKDINDMLVYGYINNSRNSMLMEHKNNQYQPKPVGSKLILMQNVCSDKTYKEIGKILCLSPRTIATNTERLCQELHVSNRFGLICLAFHKNWVEN